MLSPTVNIVLTDDEDEEPSTADEDVTKRPLIVTGHEEEGEADMDDTGGDQDELTGSKKRSKIRLPSLSVGKIRIFKPGRRRRPGRPRSWGVNCSRILSLVVVSLAAALLVTWTYRGGNVRWLLRSSGGQEPRAPGTGTCDHLDRTLVWTRTFPMLTIESALRSVGDANNDSVTEVVVAFGTGADAAYYPGAACQIYFNMSEGDTSGCGGGIMLVDGATGAPLWSRYTRHELFGVNCDLDITGDGFKDCVVSGRMAGLYAFDGLIGSNLWTLPLTADGVTEASNFYTPLIVSRDFDGDGTSDLVVVHGGDPLRKPGAKNRLPAKLMVISSRTGTVLSWSEVPDKAESYYSPQQLTRPDGSLVILFGTGGETHAGSLWTIALNDLFEKQMYRALAIYTDCCKGVMVPPVLVDITGDQVEDIVMAMFNSTLVAFDGMSYKQIWATKFEGSETYSTPAVGRFNEDNVPDFFVAYQHGPGFPVYYYTHAQVVDGKTGRTLLDSPIEMLVGTQSSPLTVSTDGAHDLFLFWFSSCTNSSGSANSSSSNSSTLSFKVLPGTNVHETSRADFCRLRFYSTLFTQFVGLSPSNKSALYSSEQFAQLEQSIRINYTELAHRWLQSHPEALLQGQDYELPNIDTSNLDSSRQSGQANAQSELNLIPFEDQPRAQQWPQNAFSRRKHPPPFGSRGLFSDQRFKRTFGPIEQFSHDGHLERSKRHVGVHDANGIQRVISTGTLAPSSKKDGSVDVIFSTFWFPPSENVKLMSVEMSSCIEKYLQLDVEAHVRLSSDNVQRSSLDHDAYEEAVNAACLKLTGERELSSMQKYNLFGKRMGAMTLYRMSLSCAGQSSKGSKGPRAKLRTYQDQAWPAYMGGRGNSFANVVPL